MKMTRKKQLLSRKNHSNSKAKTTTWRWWEYTYTILLTGLMVVGLFYWQLHASWSSFAQISNLDWRQTRLMRCTHPIASHPSSG